MPTYCAVLLDVDGTLLYSNQLHAEAWAQALCDCGHPTTAHAMQPLIGMGGDHILPLITGLEADSERGKAIAEHRQNIFKEKCLPQIQPIPGAAQAVWQAMSSGLPVVIVTSAAEEELKDLLKIAGLEDLAASAVVATEGMPSKPDADLILKALHQLAFEPGQVVMLGDTEYDIEAARRAGVDCLAVRTGGRSEATLAGAKNIYPSVVEALADGIFAGAVPAAISSQ